MIPSYMTTPVHVTTKEMIACFTLSVILSCSNLRTLLHHLPLPGGPYYLPAPWVPSSWAPSVVLVALMAGCSGRPSPWTAPPVGFQHL